MTELKPCPFCGGEVEIVEQDNYYLHFFFVHCANDDCPNTVETDAYPTEAEAVEAWNTRAEQETHDVSDRPLRFMCDACGGVSLEIAPSYCPCCGRKVVDA